MSKAAIKSMKPSNSKLARYSIKNKKLAAPASELKWNSTLLIQLHSFRNYWDMHAAIVKCKKSNIFLCSKLNSRFCHNIVSRQHWSYYCFSIMWYCHNNHKYELLLFWAQSNTGHCIPSQYCHVFDIKLRWILSIALKRQQCFHADICIYDKYIEKWQKIL